MNHFTTHQSFFLVPLSTYDEEFKKIDQFLKILDKSITITIGYLRRNAQTEKNVLVDAYIDFMTTYFENLKADNPLKECEGTD